MSLRKLITPVSTDGEEAVERRVGGLRVDIPESPAAASTDSPLLAPAAGSANPATLKNAGNLVDLLLDLFGADIWGVLRDHSALQGHYIDSSSDTPAWLEHVLDTFLPVETQYQMMAGLERNHVRPKAELAVLQQELVDVQNTWHRESETWQREREAVVADAAKLRRKLATSVDVDHVIRVGLQSAPVHLRNLMLEAAADQEGSFSLFAFALAVHWPQFVVCTADQADEEAQVRRLDAVTRRFWSSIAGLGFARRQELLSTVAACLSDMLTAFDLVSPEDSRVVDPSIHDVRGSAGQRVREGGSFIIFRRAPRVVYQQGLVTLD